MRYFEKIAIDESGAAAVGGVVSGGGTYLALKNDPKYKKLVRTAITDLYKKFRIPGNAEFNRILRNSGRVGTGIGKALAFGGIGALGAAATGAGAYLFNKLSTKNAR